MDWTSMGFVWKARKRWLKMDLNANIGLTFTPIEWGNEQKHILSAIPQGKSVFITGSAGTGKTLLLEEKKKLPICGFVIQSIRSNFLGLCLALGFDIACFPGD
ncbi:hypothetical protein VNO77_46399 [Canavalia gladiata]|uniref:Uncharacterized protein n=1 Tax=Canavalia gladiata TaxID=3824 RepID=A0AAN9JHB5_CANGL